MSSIFELIGVLATGAVIGAVIAALWRGRGFWMRRHGTSGLTPADFRTIDDWAKVNCWYLEDERLRTEA